MRLHYRALVVPDAAGLDPGAARRAARCAVSRIRRGCHLVPTGGPAAAFTTWWRFRTIPPTRPAEAPTVRHRTELLAPA